MASLIAQQAELRQRLEEQQEDDDFEILPEGADDSAGKRKPPTDKKSSGSKKKEAPAPDFRKKQKTGPRPNGLREPEQVATFNPILSPLMEPKHELYNHLVVVPPIDHTCLASLSAGRPWSGAAMARFCR